MRSKRLKKQVDLSGFTVVVTGFPRSGTSMMMRMLHFAGIEVLADEQMFQPQHKHDPHGCLEMKDVGKTVQLMSEEETANKAIKIVCPYATWIPVDRPVKAIFMQRDVNEIVTSLLAMKNIWDEDIVDTIAWTRGYLKYNDIPVQTVKYSDAIKYPKATAILVKDFLEADLDVDAMAKAIDRGARTKYKKDDKLLGHDVPEHILRIDKDAYEDLNVEVYHSVGDKPS